MYIRRSLEDFIVQMQAAFPIVVLCGQRQVGKTTLLKHLQEEGRLKANYVTLDDIAIRTLAQRDPALFLQHYSAPLIIDEFQYAPEILPYIKMQVDSSVAKGQYFLTGSQLFSMMRNVGESLAGRCVILTLPPLTQGEIAGLTREAFVPEVGAQDLALTSNVTTVFERIFQGSMPALHQGLNLPIESFYSSYIQTYLERDLRSMMRVLDESKFLRFLSLLAARTGQELNYSEIGQEVEVDRKTISSWLSVLIATGIVFLLTPWSSNTIKRISKRPKVYFYDTGLACYLALWNDPRSLELSAMAGALFETYVVGEIAKTYLNVGKEPSRYLSFYRDANRREIDLLIAVNNKVYPLEIKKSANPGLKAQKNFTVLTELGVDIGQGGIICLTSAPLPLSREVMLIPVGGI